LPNCATLGRLFLARIHLPGQAWGPWRRYQQVDCSRPGADWNRHTQYGTQAWMELGDKEAMRLGVWGRGRFAVDIRL
jgi:hypothetical protein